jgi:hypothetical protein
MKIPYHVVSAISEDEIYYVIRVPKCVSNGHMRMADGDCYIGGECYDDAAEANDDG